MDRSTQEKSNEIYFAFSEFYTILYLFSKIWKQFRYLNNEKEFLIPGTMMGRNGAADSAQWTKWPSLTAKAAHVAHLAGACAGQGGRGGHAPLRWVDGEGGNGARAAAFVVEEPWAVAGGDEERILQL
jgi:hypothetical protein